MKVLPKILLILVVAMGLMTILPKGVYADNSTKATSVINNITADTSGTNVDGLQKVVKRILGFLQIASGLIAVVMIAWTGFRYIIETPEMKSELKKNMIPIVVGILLVFFATSIARFLIGMFE